MTATGALAEVAREVEEEAATLDRELDEIGLLVQQARTEAVRHEQRSAIATERLSALQRGSPTPAGGPELKEAFDQVLSLSRRASLMEAQIDILEGKQKALTRFRDRMRDTAERIRSGTSGDGGAGGDDAGNEALKPGFTRAVLGAQEDLRREIARQMHDGPAQSLTNIALQAEIVQRLMRRDPAQAEAEVGQLIAMVQQALDATKTFIFDVRPMVLDDLGLVPTLRRVARDRSRRAQLPIDFDSVGADRRLARELESALFRIVDDAVVGYLSTRPAQVSILLDWTQEDVRATVRSRHAGDAPPAGQHPTAGVQPTAGARDNAGGQPPGDLPPALAAMIEENRSDAAAATAAAQTALAEARALPERAWTEIQARARTLGLDVALLPDGQTLSVSAGVETR